MRLRSCENRLWIADGAGGAGLSATSKNAGDWERFRLDWQTGQYAVLRTSNGKDLVAVANADGMDARGGNNTGFAVHWRSRPAFEAALHGSACGSARIALQWGGNGKFVCAEDGGGREVVVNRSAVGAWETFEATFAAKGKVRLRASNGQLWIAEDANIFARSNNPGDWEVFELVPNWGPWYKLRAHSGWVEVRDGQLHAGASAGADFVLHVL